MKKLLADSVCSESLTLSTHRPFFLRTQTLILHHSNVIGLTLPVLVYRGLTPHSYLSLTEAQYSLVEMACQVLKGREKKKIKQIKQENKTWALMEAKKFEVSTSATWQKAERILITGCARLGNSGAIKSIVCNPQQRCCSCCNVFAWCVGCLCRLTLLPADFLFPEGLMDSLIFLRLHLLFHKHLTWHNILISVYFSEQNVACLQSGARRL